ncbi:MAG: hypothetical protein Q8L54_00570 [Devosia sp.]|nr:hypothetical protein [Devosia sp.]
MTISLSSDRNWIAQGKSSPSATGSTASRPALDSNVRISRARAGAPAASSAGGTIAAIVPESSPGMTNPFLEIEKQRHDIDRNLEASLWR